MNELWRWDSDELVGGLGEHTSTSTQPSVPRLATGTRPLFELGRGTVIVFSDDRDLRAQISERVRHCGLVPLPVTTGLDAVLTLERARPRSAIITAAALGVAAVEILGFLADAYPAVACVLLNEWADPSTVERIAGWARTLDELTEIYRRR